ncbi:hypothetical protein HHK36_033395 [Tetracentron sinense]|uniref:Uncharacterized protein n=1 Tax=Tetracentron sinense TaxID=13715 RepID=A0A835CW55_TETSI|nr:hypothetical protein HHK36_033395 [Tetracentron sinense]
MKTTEIRWVAAKKVKEATRVTEAVAHAEIKALSKKFSKKRVVDSMLQVNETNISTMEIIKTVDEEAKEVKNSKRALKEALNRVEAENRGKLVIEEALRKWRAKHDQKRRSVESCSDWSKPVVRLTLSIGQILSRKLLLVEEFEMGMQMEHTT